MTGQLTANDVALQLAQLARDLDRIIRDLAQAEKDAVNAREDYSLAHAKAFLAADGAMDIRKHLAIEATHQARLDAELAEAKVRGLKRSVDSVKVRIDVGRSVGAVVRSEAALAGGPS